MKTGFKVVRVVGDTLQSAAVSIQSKRLFDLNTTYYKHEWVWAPFGCLYAYRDFEIAVDSAKDFQRNIGGEYRVYACEYRDSRSKYRNTTLRLRSGFFENGYREAIKGLKKEGLCDFIQLLANSRDFLFCSKIKLLDLRYIITEGENCAEYIESRRSKY